MAPNASSSTNYYQQHSNMSQQNTYSVPVSVRPKLLQYVEEHITSLIQDAVSIQRHTKRARLNQIQQQPTSSSATPSITSPGGGGNGSITNAASNSNTTTTDFFRTRLHAADINLALQMKGCEKLYGYPSLTSFSSSSQQQKILLSDLLKEEVPSPPDEVSMKQHWLVIDSVPTITTIDNTTILLSETAADGSSATTTTTAASGSTNHAAGSGVGTLNFSTHDSSDVLLRIHQLQSGLLSEELKLYFLRVIGTIERSNSNTSNTDQYDQYEQDMVLYQLQIDDGLQELVPFFVRYAQHAIYEHIRSSNIESCMIVVRLLHALLFNPTIHLELHLHELLPSLISCIVAKSLGNSYVTNHYQLRSIAATTLAICTNKFSTDYTTLKSRILRTLCQAIDDTDDHNNINLSSRYGGIVAIELFGNRAIDAFLLPLLIDCWEIWEEELGKPIAYGTARASTSITKELEMEIMMCQWALLSSIGTYLQSTTIDEKAERLEDLGLSDVIGNDRIMILSCDETTEYNMCFV